MTNDDIETVVTKIAKSYPPPMDAVQLKDVARISFHLSILRDHLKTGAHVVDIGGGIGMMSVAAAALGYNSTLVDDFEDEVNHKFPIDSLGVHRKYGVRVISADVLKSVPAFEPGSIDAVMSFDSMEHWHSSPKTMFHTLMAELRPGGLFLLCVPNCVNLRKRLTVPFGFGKWSSMDDWYESPVFRGHVREPDVDDLRYIARDLDLVDVRIFGRNWLGHGLRRHFAHTFVLCIDWFLQAVPGMCSDIYLLGKKRTG